MVPLRSDTFQLLQNGCSFHGLRSKDPDQHLKDFLKLVDSLDLDVENRERTCLCLFQFSFRDQASNWLERLPTGSISTWEDLTTRFLAQFFPLGRTAKLRNDILVFQQHQGESLSKAWTRFKDLLQKVPHYGIDLWLQDLALYDKESWNDPRDFAIPVKAISLPQDVPMFPTTLNQYCMKNPKQAFVDYASSCTDEAGGLVSNFMASQDARLSKFEADFKQQQGEMTNKIDIVLKAITNRMTGALPSDTVKNPKLNVNSTSLVLSAFLAHAPIYNAIMYKYVESLELGKNGSAFIQDEMAAKIEDLRLFTLPCKLGDSKPFDTLSDLGSCVNIIPLYLFKKLKIGLLEETGHVFGLVDGTKSYPVGIVRDVEVHIGKLKLLNDFYVIDMKKDPKTSLLVGRGFLATANTTIDCRKSK
ncbi:zinc finger, CCHC-type containing protein [Tanacetum coccineum]